MQMPDVLECMHFSVPCSTYGQRTVKNYEIDLYLDGKRRIGLDGVQYANTDHCLIFRRPGQVASGVGDYNMFILTLDFSGKVAGNEKLFRPIDGSVQPVCDNPMLDEIPSVFRPYHFEELVEIMKALAECSYPSVVDKQRQAALVKEVLLLVLHDAARHNRKNSSEQALNHHVKSACDYFARHFGEDVNVADVAAHLHVNANHLIRLFKKHLGISPNQYLADLRLAHARYMLLQSDSSVQEIAFACGFNTPSYFAKRFLERYGMLPKDARKQKSSI